MFCTDIDIKKMEFSFCQSWNDDPVSQL